MPAANSTDEMSGTQYYQTSNGPPTRVRVSSGVSTPQPERSTPTPSRPLRHDSRDAKPYSSERESKKSQADRELSDTPPVINTTTTSKRPTETRSGHGSRLEITPDTGSSDPLTDKKDGAPEDFRERERIPIKGPTGKPTRAAVTASSSYATQGAERSSKDALQPPPGVAEGNPPRGSAASKHGSQAVPGHLPEAEPQDVTMSDIRQGPNHNPPGVFGSLLSFMPTPPPKDKYQALNDDLYRVKAELKQAHAHIESYKHDLQRSRAEVRSAGHYINELHHDKQRLKDHSNALENELNSVRQQLEDAKTLSEVRGKELFGAQVFLTKADTLSISEVGEKVITLNEEIFQAAATLGETLIHQRYELSQAEFDTAAAECQEMVGGKIASLLNIQAQNSEPEVNPLIVQVVLQIFMVKFCVSKIQAWYPSDPTIGGFLNAIYSEIRLSEEQAVSGRWRALTRAHTRPNSETWTSELFQKLLRILQMAEWLPSSPESQESFRHRLPPIYKAVNELRMAIGENFTSADLEVYVCECNTLYDPSYMEDAYGDGRNPGGKRAPETVVGTTGIGLKKLMVERGAKDNLRWQNVISAKIVLESTLKEALEPVQFSSRLPKKKKKPVENTDGKAEDRG